MKREYAQIQAGFWEGATGKALRREGSICQFLGLYLITGPSANMIGLYYLPVPLICHHLGITNEGALKALERVEAVEFAFYSHPEETVWVPEMARYQVGDRLDAKDNRCKGVARQLQQYRKSVYYKRFVGRYGTDFNLAGMVTTPDPFEAPSKPLRSQEQEQEHEHDHEQGMLLPSAAPVESGKKNGKPQHREPPSGAYTQVVTHYFAAYEGAHGKKPLFRAKEGKLAKDLISKCAEVGEDPKAVIDRYFADGSKFFSAHTLQKLISQLQEFLIDAPAPRGTNGHHPPERSLRENLKL